MNKQGRPTLALCQQVLSHVPIAAVVEGTKCPGTTMSANSRERERGNDRAASTARKESRNLVRNRSSLSVPYFSSSNLKSLGCHKNLTELEVRSGANACFATELDKPFFCFGL